MFDVQRDFDMIDEPEKVKVNGKNHYFDSHRDMKKSGYVQCGPEEYVRQKTIGFLQVRLNVPDNYILCEQPMSEWVKRKRGRADIIVCYTTNAGDTFYPLAVVECKSEQIGIDSRAYEQAKKYAEILGAGYVITTNGVDLCQYKNTGDDFEEVDSLVDYHGMLNNEGVIIDPLEVIRCDEAIIDRDTQRIEDYGFEYDILGEDVPVELYEPIVQMADALKDFDHKMPMLKNEFFEIVHDRGFKFRRYGDHSGERSFGRGFYRCLEIKLHNGNHSMIYLGILPTGRTVNDPVYKNSKGCSMLTVAVDNGVRDQIEIELNFNRFMKYDSNKDRAVIWHNGETRRTGADLNVLKGIIKKKCPRLIRDNTIYLGEIDTSVLLYLENEDFAQFLMNLITFVLIRAEYKQKIMKANKK